MGVESIEYRVTQLKIDGTLERPDDERLPHAHPLDGTRAPRILTPLTRHTMKFIVEAAMIRQRQEHPGDAATLIDN